MHDSKTNIFYPVIPFLQLASLKIDGLANLPVRYFDWRINPLLEKAGWRELFSLPVILPW